MTPVHNWRKVLRYAWSIRLTLLAAVLSGIEVALPFFEYSIPGGNLRCAVGQRHGGSKSRHFREAPARAIPIIAHLPRSNGFMPLP